MISSVQVRSEKEEERYHLVGSDSKQRGRRSVRTHPSTHIIEKWGLDGLWSQVIHTDEGSSDLDVNAMAGQGCGSPDETTCDTPELG